MSTPEARKRAQQRFHERHPEYRAEALRRYRERHPEKARESTARYAAKPEAKTAKSARAKKWREANPERVREYARDYQRRRRSTVVGDIREIQGWARVLEVDPCAYCGHCGGEVDHIVALASGGTHSVDNLTGACKACNSGKQTASLLHFMLRRAQNNTLAVFTDPDACARFTAELVAEHLAAVSHGGRLSSAVPASATELRRRAATSPPPVMPHRS